MSEDNAVSILPPSSIDRRLIRGAAKYMTAQQLSEYVLGQLTPAQAQNRVIELLESKTILDEVKERRLLLVQMAEHLDWMKEQRDNPKSWTAISRMYKILSDQIERSTINVSDITGKLAAEHAMYFVEALNVGFEKIARAIAEKGEIVIPEEDILELVEVGSTASKEYLDRVTVKELDA